MRSVLRCIAVAAAAMVACVGGAQAALLGVVEVDLTVDGPQVLSRDFAVPGGDAWLRATAGSMNGSTPAPEPRLSLSGAWGLGVANSDGDNSHALDNAGWADFIEFSMPSALGTDFTLVGIEFGYVDWSTSWTPVERTVTENVCVRNSNGKPASGSKCRQQPDKYHWEEQTGTVVDYVPVQTSDDDFALWVDGAAPVAQGTIAGNAGCGTSGGPSGSNYACRVGLAAGLAAYVDGAGATGLDDFDYYLEIDAADLTGDSFRLGGLPGGNDDGFKVTRLYLAYADTGGLDPEEVAGEPIAQAVPAPATLALFALALAGLQAARRRPKA